MAFLALLATLTRLVVEGASRDVGDCRRVPGRPGVGGVSEAKRLFTTWLGVRSDDPTSDTSISERTGGGEGRERKAVNL